jgi:hypothetical protein
MIQDSENKVYWVLMVNGVQQSLRYESKALAEMQKANLPLTEQANAQIVPVAESGSQVLFG